MQPAMHKGHVLVGRDDVGAVGLYLHPVGDLMDLHLSIASDQVGEYALVIGIQVLHQDKGHAAFGGSRHVGKECFESSQPSSRGADANDWKVNLLRAFRGGPYRRSHLFSFR
jgi:hypothetical protein